MKPKGLAWLAVKTESFEAMDAFFRTAFEVEPIFEADDFAIYGLPNGDKIELFGPNGPHPEGFFDASPVVAGFEVTDIESARDDLSKATASMWGPIQKAEPPYVDALGPEYRWQHWRAPDGAVYEVLANPRRPAAGREPLG